MVLWKRVTVGELAVITTMVVSLLLFLVKVGEWKATVEVHERQSQRSEERIEWEIKDLNSKVDDSTNQEQEYLNRFNNRLTSVETKINKKLGLPPYGPDNPPPIIIYKHRRDDGRDGNGD